MLLCQRLVRIQLRSRIEVLLPMEQIEEFLERNPPAVLREQQ